MSTIDTIPAQLHRALSDSKNISLQDVIKAIVTHIALESGFVKSSTSTHPYTYTWFYSFDKKVFEDCTYNSSDSSQQNTIFKFVMDQQFHINVKCFFEVGDLVIINAYEENNLSNVIHCESLVFPISRYIPFKKLITPLTSSFRNLKELSFKLKQNIFHPLRHDIYYRNQQFSSSPWLNGMPEFILENIHKCLNKKDRRNLRLTCKTQHQIRL